MIPDPSRGFFRVSSGERIDLEAFASGLVSWSLKDMQDSAMETKRLGLLQAIKLSPLGTIPFSACLISYHAAIYIVMLIEYSGFPLEDFEKIKLAVVKEIMSIKNDRDSPVFSSNEEKLANYLISKYSKRIGQSFSQDPRAITFGPGGDVLETVKELYRLNLESLGLELNFELPAYLNSRIAATHQTLIEEGACKWECAVTGEGLRSEQEIIDEFKISKEEFDRYYAAYKFSLGASGAPSDWNAEIDDYARSLNALTEKEIVAATFNFDRAILNRIIMRYSVGRERT